MNLENKTLFKFALLAICVGLVLNITGIIIGKRSSEMAAIFVHPSNFQSTEVNEPSLLPTSSAIDEQEQKTQEKIEPTTLMFVGDIMLSRSVGDKMKKLNNWNWPFEKIADYLAGADLTFGNLEGPVSDKGKNLGNLYSFRADPKAMEGLKYAGFDILSVANNHIGDWAKAAMDDTFKILKENGIDYAGGGLSVEEAHSVKVEEVNGTKIGFLAYTALGAKYTEATASSSGIAWLNKEKMAQDIAEAKKISDLVIVSIHFGDEYKQKSNNFQKDIARSAIDAGASLVIGHHPHVVEEIEQYKNSWIAYSLGNFIFDQTFSKETMRGELLKVIVEGKQIKQVEPQNISISKDFQATLAN